MTCEDYLKLCNEDKNIWIAENIFGFIKQDKPFYGCTHKDESGGWWSIADYQNWEGFGIILGRISGFSYINNLHESYGDFIFTMRLDNMEDKNVKEFIGTAKSPTDAIVCAWIEMKDRE